MYPDGGSNQFGSLNFSELVTESEFLLRPIPPPPPRVVVPPEVLPDGAAPDVERFLSVFRRLRLSERGRRLDLEGGELALSGILHSVGREVVDRKVYSG